LPLCRKMLFSMWRLPAAAVRVEAVAVRLLDHRAGHGHGGDAVHVGAVEVAGEHRAVDRAAGGPGPPGDAVALGPVVAEQLHAGVAHVHHRAVAGQHPGPAVADLGVGSAPAGRPGRHRAVHDLQPAAAGLKAGEAARLGQQAQGRPVHRQAGAPPDGEGAGQQPRPVPAGQDVGPPVSGQGLGQGGKVDPAGEQLHALAPLHLPDGVPAALGWRPGVGQDQPRRRPEQTDADQHEQPDGQPPPAPTTSRHPGAPP
jgi:hypothetical protein